MGSYFWNGKRKFGSRGSVVGGKHFVNGTEVTKDEFDLAFPAKPLGETLPAHSSACWPQTMEALAVHPSQVDEANTRARRHGIDAVYEKGTGMVQLGSRADRAKLIRLEGGYDRSGGYGDG